MDYQVSVEGSWNRRKTWTFQADSDEQAIARVGRYKRMVEKLHNMSTTPNTLLIRNGEISNES